VAQIPEADAAPGEGGCAMSQQIEKRRKKRLRRALAGASSLRALVQSKVVSVRDIMGNERKVRRFAKPARSWSRRRVRERVR
jgi:hypothetical protein